MKKETGSLIWGIILIIIGILFLGNNLNWFSFGFNEFWPSLIILGGLFFWFGWLTNRREFGLLMQTWDLVLPRNCFGFAPVQTTKMSSSAQAGDAAFAAAVSLT